VNHEYRERGEGGVWRGPRTSRQNRISGMNIGPLHLESSCGFAFIKRIELKESSAFGEGKWPVSAGVSREKENFVL